MKFKNSWDKLKSDKKEIAFAKHIKYMKVDHKLKKIKGDKILKEMSNFYDFRC